MLTSLATTTLPDVGIDAYLSPTTILAAAGVGIASVALTPLLLVRRLQRMNLPGTLRVSSDEATSGTREPPSGLRITAATVQ